MQEMNLPVSCEQHCKTETMVDWENLESRPLSKLFIEYGYTCEGCHKWKPLYYSNLQLEESLHRLKYMSYKHPSYSHLLRKAYRRSIEIQKRGRLLNAEISSIK